MSLTPGTRIGVYEVVSALGAGGMGEVCRAKDTRLGRSVALKTLPPEFALDPDRRARFEREAKTLATLNHPHIAQIYGLEEVPGVDGAPPMLALAMELVEGEDLAQRISRGPVPLDEAVPLARQIAEGLEAAHEAGIVHRDLKPANIRVTADGVVKVLDFGLAKPIEPIAASAQITQSPTLTSPALTSRGVVLGTAAYMAPEQAKGKPVDRRADIWAFGCVLYELLTGRRAFEGEDVTDILAAIVKTEPDWTRLPATTPRHIRTLLTRCLAKDKTQRLQHIGDARLGLAEVQPDDQDPPSNRARRRPMTWGVGGALTGAAAAVALLSLRPSPQVAHSDGVAVLRYTLPIPTTRYLGPSNFALSPDGTSIAYAGPGFGTDPREYGALEIRRLDRTETARLATFGVPIRGLAWSPDSRSLLTNSSGLRVIDVATGRVQEIDRRAGGFLTYGVAWGEDQTYLRAEGVDRIATFNGTSPTSKPQVVPAPSGAAAAARLFPVFLSDGRRYAFLSRPGAASAGDVCIGSLDSVDATCLGLSTASGVQIASGALLYLNGRDLLAQPFDEATLRLSGAPERLESNVALGYLGLGAFSASRNGRIAYRTGDAGVETMVWSDRAGGSGAVVSGKRVVLNFDLSRDGTIVADTDGEKLWITDLRRSATTRVSVPTGLGVTSLALSTDGTKVALPSVVDPTKLALLDLAGGREPILIERQGGLGLVEDWSSDGQWIALVSGWLVSTTGGAPVRFVTPPEGAGLDEVEFSPDGRWVSYNLGGGTVGATQVFVSPASGSGERWQISTSGGAQGRWSPDGREIFYLAPNGDLMAVSVSAAGARPVFSAATNLFATGLRVSAIQDQFHVGPDGRFLISRPVIPPDQEAVSVVVNWPALLTSARSTSR